MKALLRRLALHLGLIEPRTKLEPLRIPQGTTWTGGLSCNHDVIVEGTVVGDVSSARGCVTIRPGGVLRAGHVRAATVEWLGELSGATVVCETLRIEPTARNQDGDPSTATYQHLRIVDGVAVDATLRHRQYEPADHVIAEVPQLQRERGERALVRAA